MILHPGAEDFKELHNGGKSLLFRVDQRWGPERVMMSSGYSVTEQRDHYVSLLKLSFQHDAELYGIFTLAVLQIFLVLTLS